MLDDVEHNGSAIFHGDFTLDLNGHTYINTSRVKGDVFTVPSNAAVTVSEGKIAKIKGTVVKRNSGKKLLGTNHCKRVRYFSANPAVAKINGSGVITGVAKGTCKVYAMGANGVKKAVTVTVK